MKVFKKKGELTRFQILAEIAQQQPHLRQKDIAEKLGITVQAVSENIISLAQEGLVEIGQGHGKYKITKRGIEKVKTEAVNLRKYADHVLEIMNTYKTIWPAIAEEDLKAGERVGLMMIKGTLYARHEITSAYGEVLKDALPGEDVPLIRLGGTIELNPGKVVIIKLPTISKGGSRATDFDKIKQILENMSEIDKIGIMGTVSKAVTNKLGILPDFEFATPHATVAAAKRGVNVLVFAVGKMTQTITRKLDDANINYVIEDLYQGQS